MIKEAPLLMEEDFKNGVETNMVNYMVHKDKLWMDQRPNCEKET